MRGGGTQKRAGRRSAVKVDTLNESVISDIGHAFGYYNYGDERGLIDAFPGRDAAAAFICGYVRMALVHPVPVIEKAIARVQESGILKK